LIRDGAKPVTCAEDILEELNLTAAVQQQEVQRAVPSDPFEAALLKHLSDAPTHVDELRRATSMPIAAVSSTLTLLELKGLARHVGGMQFVRGRA
jgi:DNA processing protein